MASRNQGRRSLRYAVAVIGAGANGLPSIKCCIEEGIKVVCFEKTDTIAGLWAFREEVIEGVGSVMRSTTINSSKEMSAFGDFPPPASLPNYMHNSDVKNYFQMYVDHFKLNEHIRFKHTVEQVLKADDFEETGEWILKGYNDNGTFEGRYSAVLIATGHYVLPIKPDFPGLSKFKGPIVHTHEYKDYTGYEQKNVLIIGVGNSGCDVAVELSRISKEVYMSARTGGWFLQRVGWNGLPLDIGGLSRYILFIKHLMPKPVYNWLIERELNKRFDHKLYGLQPGHRYTQQQPLINDALPHCIITGTVKIKSDIHRFSENGVRFKGEENTEYPVDRVILATGYDAKFPFLDKSIIDTDKKKLSLYKYVFPPEMSHPTLAFVGLITVQGPVLPIGELQARWVAKILTGKLSLPSEQEMMRDIEKKRKAANRDYIKADKNTFQVNYETYTDEMATLIGAKPQLLKLLFTDPKLFSAIVWGPYVPYQYRLDTWPGARDAILTVMDRVKLPLQTSIDYHRKQQPNANFTKFAFQIIVFAILAYVILKLF